MLQEVHNIFPVGAALLACAVEPNKSQKSMHYNKVACREAAAIREVKQLD